MYEELAVNSENADVATLESQSSTPTPLVDIQRMPVDSTETQPQVESDSHDSSISGEMCVTQETPELNNEQEVLPSFLVVADDSAADGANKLNENTPDLHNEREEKEAPPEEGKFSPQKLNDEIDGMFASFRPSVLQHQTSLVEEEEDTASQSSDTTTSTDSTTTTTTSSSSSGPPFDLCLVNEELEMVLEHAIVETQPPEAGLFFWNLCRAQVYVCRKI